MNKRETCLSLNVHITYPTMLTLKSALDDAITRQSELSVHLKNEPVEPGPNGGIDIVIGIYPHTDPDGGDGSESDKKEEVFLSISSVDDGKSGGLSDERLNGHSVFGAEELGAAPDPGDSPESADEEQEVTLNGSKLSARQREVLGLLSQGNSNQDIAFKLSISPNTAKAHVRNVMSKLHAVNRTQAALAARTLLKKG